MMNVLRQPRNRFSLLLATAVLLLGLLPVPSANAYTGGFHYHEGWTKYTVLEQFGVTATETYIKMSYWQDVNRRFSGSTEVGGANYVDGYCYNSGFLNGWETRDCIAYPIHNEPYTEQFDIVGEFYYAGGYANYRQHSYAKALNDDRFEYICYFEWGSLPNNWSQDCQGGRS